METWGFVANLVAALAAVLALIWAALTYTQGRRRKIRVTYQRTALMRPASDGGSDSLEVRVRSTGVRLVEPFSVRVQLQSMGTKDVSQDSFAGRDLEVELGAPVMSLVAVDGHPDSRRLLKLWQTNHRSVQTTGSPTAIHFEPALLSVRAPWSFTAICEGEPEPRIFSKLADVDFIFPPDVAVGRGLNQLVSGILLLLASLLVFPLYFILKVPPWVTEGVGLLGMFAAFVLLILAYQSLVRPFWNRRVS